jgi:RND superfamily putative drug exporter
MVTEVSIFSLNLTTAMGLGLAIDYSLFMVNRYREELHNGYEPDEAVRRTVRTAGRTVAFSAGTVAASLCALLVFPLSFLRSFAYAGVAVAFLPRANIGRLARGEENRFELRRRRSDATRAASP